ncbi:MAG: hypothetical protein KJ578_02880 [Bacteroidetes bacterium]|nr:hypothetical protein [Bacteroidota bacterium]MBU1580070.1 hypothetical protein [Bacteroidota bacterium]MBU2556706.1 hypothetical protein [Bacteroidota bacterium]
MKKIFFTLAATVFIAGILLTSCNSPSKKIEKAEDNVVDAKEAVIDAQSDLNQAIQDSITEFQQFRIKFQNQITANEKSITDLRLSIANASQTNKIIYEKKLAELEERNNTLKIKLAEYNEEETDKWQTFKSEFKRDMDELGKAFSDFTVSSKD